MTERKEQTGRLWEQEFRYAVLFKAKCSWCQDDIINALSFYDSIWKQNPGCWEKSTRRYAWEFMAEGVSGNKIRNLILPTLHNKPKLPFKYDYEDCYMVNAYSKGNYFIDTFIGTFSNLPPKSLPYQNYFSNESRRSLKLIYSHLNGFDFNPTDEWSMSIPNQCGEVVELIYSEKAWSEYISQYHHDCRRNPSVSSNTVYVPGPSFPTSRPPWKNNGQGPLMRNEVDHGYIDVDPSDLGRIEVDHGYIDGSPFEPPTPHE